MACARNSRVLNNAGALCPQVPKKCVVTGGLGFVGQRLVETLVERGAQQARGGAVLASNACNPV